MRVTTTLISVQRQLAQTLDAETIPQIVAARKMSQANNAQRAQREAAMQVALRTAADVPLEVMRLSALGLEQAQTVAARGCRAASTDTELAVALLRIGLIGARPTLEQKLGSLTDETYTQTVIDGSSGSAMKGPTQRMLRKRGCGFHQLDVRGQAKNEGHYADPAGSRRT